LRKKRRRQSAAKFREETSKKQGRKLTLRYWYTTIPGAAQDLFCIAQYWGGKLNQWVTARSPDAEPGA
jgi:hypothetical protein